MADEIFIDTSGFYAILVKGDEAHPLASGYLQSARQARRRFATSDYVLDETATLLKARGFAHLVPALFGTLLASKACQLIWTDAARFHGARAFFLKHLDQAWSFTDCVSFCLMKELHIREALTKDIHFQQAGFVALLRDHE